MRIRLGYSVLGLAVLLGASAMGAQTAQYGLVVNAFAGGAAAVCAAATDAVGDGCPALQSTMVTPFIGASDPVGNYYVADQGSAANTARVRRVDVRTGVITTVAGGAAAVCAAATNAIGDGCAATQATLAAVRSIVFDAAGDMYIADTSDSVIRYVDAKTQVITSVAGTGVVGTSSTVFSSTTPIAANKAVLGNVIGMALDKVGNLYLSFSNQYQVLLLVAVNGKVTASSLLYAVAGTGVKGYVEGAGTVAQFNSARGLGIDLAGNLILADYTNNRVRKITSPYVAGVLSIGTVVVSTVAGNGTAGSTGDGTLATTAEIDAPESVVVDSQGSLYIATVGTGNGYIRKVSAAGIISTVAFKGTYGNTGDGGAAIAATENAAQGLSMDVFGNLYLGDSANNRVRKLTLNTVLPATAVAATSAAQSVVLIPSAATTLKTDAVAAGFGDFKAGTLAGCTIGTAAAAAANCVTPVTFAPVQPGDRTAPLVITDSTNVQYVAGLTGLGLAGRIGFSPAAIKTYVGTGTAGYTGDNAAAVSAKISAPRGGVFDSAGNMFFADSANNVVRKVSAAGVISTVAGTGTAGFAGDGLAATSAMLSAPTYVVVDAAGDLFIADTGNNRVREVTAGTGLMSTVAGGATAGYSGDAGLGTSALLSGPTGLMYDSLGNLYIADTGNNVVRRLLPTGVIFTFAGTGTAGYSGDGAFAGAATLKAPQGVAADDAGNVYIADTGNNVVRVVNGALSISTFAGVQTLTTNSGDGGPAAIAGLKSPTDVSVDASGELYVMAGNVVRVVDATGKISSMAGSAAAGGYGGDGASAPATALGTLADNVMVDGAGNVYVSDTAANLILQVTAATAPVLSFADTVVAANSASQTVTVTNTGNQPLTFTGDAVSAQFTQTNSGASCASTTGLAPGTSCVVNAVFSPTTSGPQTGTITLTDNSLNAAGSAQVIGLSGKGLAAIGTTPQTITFGALPNVTYGVAPITLTATTSAAGLSVSYAVTGTAPVTLVGSVLTINGAGTVSVTATQGGNATYAVATPVTQSFTVAKATLTYTATSFTQAVNTAIPTLTYTFSGLVNGDAASVVTGAPALSTTATQASPAGVYPVVIMQGTLAAANYTFVFVNGTITIQPADFTLTAAPTAITIQRGYVGLVTLTMTPINKYSGTAALSCSALPANVKCVFLPTSLTGSGGTAVSVGGLSITTSTGVAENRLPTLGKGQEIALAGLMLGLLGLARKRKLARLLAVFAAIGLVSMTGCVTQTTGLAAAGTTQITVTATDSASNLSHAVVVSLTLQ